MKRPQLVSNDDYGWTAEVPSEASRGFCKLTTLQAIAKTVPGQNIKQPRLADEAKAA